MTNKRDMGISKFMSLVLRHKPEEANLKLDEYGYVNTSDLIIEMNKKGYIVSISDIKRVVTEDNKQRYSFNNDESKIKANQGHSLNVNLELKEIEPPTELYHGTATRFSNSILKNGITKQSRQHVHLSDNTQTAITVGSRHGSPVVFIINSKQMYLDGYKFYLSKNGVWLTDFVPNKYITLI